jgi:hypothetical protein
MPQRFAKGPEVAATALKKKDLRTGKVYTRFPKNERRLTELLTLPRERIVLLCQIPDEEDPDFVPNECLVHLVRACREEPANPYFESLYKNLLKRMIRRLPSGESENGKRIALKDSRIQEEVLDRFRMLLAEDRNAYEERLDFWEVAFGKALKKLKITVEVKVWRETNRSSPLENPETGEVWAHVSEAVDPYEPFGSAELLKKDYRERLPAAIAKLNPEHRRIIKMFVEGYPAHSTDEDAITIATVLKVSDKTARTRRKQALAALKRVLEKEDAQ